MLLNPKKKLGRIVLQFLKIFVILLLASKMNMATTFYIHVRHTHQDVALSASLFSPVSPRSWIDRSGAKAAITISINEQRSRVCCFTLALKAVAGDGLWDLCVYATTTRITATWLVKDDEARQIWLGPGSQDRGKMEEFAEIVRGWDAVNFYWVLNCRY